MPNYIIQTFNEIYDLSLTILEGPEISDEWQEFCNKLIPEAAKLALEDQLVREEKEDQTPIDWSDIKPFLIQILIKYYGFRIATLKSANYSGGYITSGSDDDYGDPTNNDLLGDQKEKIYKYNDKIFEYRNKDNSVI